MIYLSDPTRSNSPAEVSPLSMKYWSAALAICLRLFINVFSQDVVRTLWQAGTAITPIPAVMTRVIRPVVRRLEGIFPGWDWLMVLWDLGLFLL